MDVKVLLSVDSFTYQSIGSAWPIAYLILYERYENWKALSFFLNYLLFSFFFFNDLICAMYFVSDNIEIVFLFKSRQSFTVVY